MVVAPALNDQNEVTVESYSSKLAKVSDMQNLENISFADGQFAGAGCNPEERDHWVIEPSQTKPYDTLLDQVFAEHHRQRHAAHILRFIANGDFSHYGIADLIVFFEKDYAQHISDEELIFFPMLRKQCLPEDNIDLLLNRLSDEHKAEEAICDDAIKALKELLAGRSLTIENQRTLRVFAEHIYQHLAVENAVLLPIARVRMDKESLETMSELIKQR